MTPVGYEFLRQTLQLAAFAPRCPALLKPVTRVEPTDGFLAPVIPQAKITLRPKHPMIMRVSSAQQI